MCRRPKQKKDWNEVLQSYRERQGQKAAAVSEPAAAAGKQAPAAAGKQAPAATEKQAPAAAGKATSEADVYASEKQKSLIIELVHQKYLNPVPKNIMEKLTKDKASSIIRAGLARKEKNEPAPAEKNMATQKQRQAVWSLANQGALPRITDNELNRLTFDQAAKMISEGKKNSLDNIDAAKPSSTQKKTNNRMKMHV